MVVRLMQCRGLALCFRLLVDAEYGTSNYFFLLASSAALRMMVSGPFAARLAISCSMRPVVDATLRC